MQDSEDKLLNDHEFNPNGGRAWLAVLLAILVAATGYSVLRLFQDDQQRAELLRTNQTLQSSLDQAKNDLRTTADQLNAAQARAQMAQLPPPVAQVDSSIPNDTPESPVPARPVHKAKKASHNRQVTSAPPAPDPRWGEMDAKLAAQQQQIEGTKSDIAKAREDLEGRIGSTRDELNGSIAKTHDEVEELRKRGERNYYEFDLTKSQEYARTGPVSLSLRKANVKHKYFDLALIVDDQRIEKKHVNIFEPLWVSVPGHLEPVQVVVNSITKDNVKGYLSESKYKKSELANSASARTSVSNPNSPNSAPSQPGTVAPDKGLKQSLQE